MDSILARQLAQFQKTNRILFSLKLGASGWRMLSTDAEKMLAPQVYVCLHDLAAGWTWVASVPHDSFSKTAEHARRLKSSWPDIRNALGIGIRDQAQAGFGPELPPPAIPGQSQEWEQHLALLGAAYSGTTQVAALPGAIEPGAHFIVLRYAQEAGNSLLRPFVQGKLPDGLVAPSDLQALVDYVVGMDRQRHPEWFGQKKADSGPTHSRASPIP